MKVKVSQPFRVVHDGVAYSPGDSPEVPDEVGKHWVRRGWAAEVCSEAFRVTTWG